MDIDMDIDENIESNCSLFKLPILNTRIDQWVPLTCTQQNPFNCGPTTLALSGILSIEKAQRLSNLIETTGMTLEQLTTIMSVSLSREELKLIIDRPIDKFRMIVDKLTPGYLTIIGLSTVLTHEITDVIGARHIVVIANIDGVLMLFDAQINLFYYGTTIDDYLVGQNYNYFYFWCSKIKLKRTTDINPIRRVNDKPKKKARIGGKRTRKTHKYKKYNKLCKKCNIKKSRRH
jgi:hypothetical protein